MVEKINIEHKKHPCILLAALDWGLGHATRCIPIIRFLSQNGCEVIVAAEGKQRSLLQLEFPNLQFVHLKGYHLQYSNNRWKTIVKIIAQIPKILRAVNTEHQWLRRFAQQKRIDAVISDNRYGFYLRKVPSVLITHQLKIQTPFGRPGNKLVNLLNYRAIRAFDSCWVPDLAGVDNLGGDLSHPVRLPAVNVSYIGPLSRFSLPDITADSELLLAIISGPEPQRTIFEKRIISEAGKLTKKFIMVRGLPGRNETITVPHNISVYNHLPTAELELLVAKAEFVIGRPGYSTVMEMLAAGKKCLFIPTPGQSEQEYLARYLSKKKYCISENQERFSLVDMVRLAEHHQWPRFKQVDGMLEKVLDSFVKRISALT